MPSPHRSCGGVLSLFQPLDLKHPRATAAAASLNCRVLCHSSPHNLNRRLHECPNRGLQPRHRWLLRLPLRRPDPPRPPLLPLLRTANHPHSRRTQPDLPSQTTASSRDLCGSFAKMSPAIFSSTTRGSVPLFPHRTAIFPSIDGNLFVSYNPYPLCQSQKGKCNPNFNF